ncbi:MAG: HAMP domain-containing sensor histidine kinase, partial [Hyphomicrobiaceae bacterium]
MGRLYFRIYLAVLGSLAIFAILAGITWRLFGDFDRFGPRAVFYPAAAEQLVPPAIAPPEIQRAALDHWRTLSGYDLAIFNRDGELIADASDGSLLPPRQRRERFGPGHEHPHFWSHVVQLSDGRWLVAAKPIAKRGPWQRFAWLAALLAITATVGLCAYPVVRRLTRRLETLERSVEALGSGHLSARVKVEGHDEVARLATTFNRSADRIEALVSTSKSLLANASHELRSPLARLRMGIEALPDGGGKIDRGELTRNIKELDQLIDEILLASRLDALSNDETTFEAVDLVALLAEECARGGVELHFANQALPIVRADPRLLRRLIRNLLENARHHGNGADIEVTVNAIAGGSVDFDFCDRGPGVPAPERERIFEPFHRVTGASEKNGGVGLGLSLVRQIATRHGGNVVCLPREGGGSCFKVSLPTTP